MGFDVALFNQDDKYVYEPEGVELALKLKALDYSIFCMLQCFHETTMA